MNIKIKNIITAIFIGYYLIGCAGKSKTSPKDDKILTDAEVSLKDKDYKKASDSFKLLLKEYPDSRLRVDAQIGLADSLYYLKSYDEAILEYQNFIEIYPADKRVEKAYNYKGLSYFEQRNSIDRNQTYTENALKEFEFILTNFKDSKYYTEAKEKYDICKETLARNLLYIGKFYYRTGKFYSSIIRLNEFLKEYSDQKMTDEALYYLGMSYIKRENTKTGLDTLNMLIEKYGDSQYSLKAKKTIENIQLHSQDAKF